MLGSERKKRSRKANAWFRLWVRNKTDNFALAEKREMPAPQQRWTLSSPAILKAIHEEEMSSFQGETGSRKKDLESTLKCSVRANCCNPASARWMRCISPRQLLWLMLSFLPIYLSYFLGCVSECHLMSFYDSLVVSAWVLLGLGDLQPILNSDNDV